jgi:2,5-diketo-D-gluconate reductase B
LPLEETMGALARLREEGKAREIGVKQLPARSPAAGAGARAGVRRQVEYHSFLGQEPLLAVAGRTECLITAYAPLAQGKVTRDPVIREIAEAPRAHAGQVALRWLLDQPGRRGDSQDGDPRAADRELRRSSASA